MPDNDLVYLCNPIPGGGLMPELLCEVRAKYVDGSFDFWVVNGAWDGKFKSGDVFLGTEKVGSGVIVIPVPHYLDHRSVRVPSGWSNDYAEILEIGRELLMSKASIRRLKLQMATQTLRGFFPRLYGAIRTSIYAFRYTFNHPEKAKPPKPPKPRDFQDTDIPF